MFACVWHHLRVSAPNAELARRQVCEKHGCEYSPLLDQDTVGIALSTMGRIPVNGLRHPTSPGTTGWYIWCGETMSDAPDYFYPLCVEHLVKDLPIVSALLGLPPGFRFLIADSYIDVWYDKNLLLA
jgi:hypothetical protein